MNVVELLGKKRAGLVLSDAEIKFFVQGFATGTIPDYQCAAFLMAVCCNGMTGAETAALTRAMKDSGTTADLSDILGPKVDKHSTGGVGDKTSLILAPIVASLGAIVPMMSGRGLGHTGGTLDKLEAIPGFRVSLTEPEFKETLRDVGFAIVSTTADMAPADKKMYALRDVTSTVSSLPLITGSIMCKKLAENPDSLVLDVKTGSGAFMKTESSAIELAQSMIAAGEGDGKCTTAFVTAMDQPLGRAVGNWLEIVESIRTLEGKGPDDLTDLSVTLAGQMILQAHRGSGKAFLDLTSASKRAREQLYNGEALAAFRRLVVAQGGDPRVVDDVSSSPHGPGAAVLDGGAKCLEIFQVLYGAANMAPASFGYLSSMENTYGGKEHGCFWGGACQGLEGCRDIDAYFRRAYGVDSPPETTTKHANSLEVALQQSQCSPHGPVVARVRELDALEVGQACVGIGAGRRALGEELSLGSGVLLHKKVGDTLRQGDVLFTLFAEVGGTSGPTGTRRVIEGKCIDEACLRIINAYGFTPGDAAQSSPAEKLIRCFVDSDGSITRM